MENCRDFLKINDTVLLQKDVNMFEQTFKNNNNFLYRDIRPNNRHVYPHVRSEAFQDVFLTRWIPYRIRMIDIKELIVLIYTPYGMLSG